jgi:hypothetical protein
MFKEKKTKGAYLVGNTWSHLGHLKGGQIINSLHLRPRKEKKRAK